MRTTLTIDDDVLHAARAIAQLSKKTIGEAVTKLARSALVPRAAAATRNGVPLLPVRQAGKVVTLEMVNALRDEAP